ncbi:MAG: glycosyltransferase [Candidatus Pacebacteria bacterium]|nr:glycosyltransferase [Candidatus Paceibacterota bacterium]
MKKIFVSVIIPVRTATAYLKQTIAHLEKQSLKSFELIVVTDRKERIKKAKVIASLKPGPAYKRNLGAEKARGEILAFLDDDSYPSRDWLQNALRVFEDAEAAGKEEIVGVCGPCLTPPGDNLYQKASGWVFASWLGSGGAGTYRNKISRRRMVDDYPSVNLLIKKKVFLEVGGFDVNHWPGEDTKLCFEITKDRHHKIIYDPGVLVYHHRRLIMIPHLKQISRYALRRGFFAKKFPATSFRFGYWAPTLFVCFLFLGGIFSWFSAGVRIFYLLGLGIYFFCLILSGTEVFLKERNFFLVFLVMAAIFLTHLWYGLLFPVGYFQKDLGVVPHQVDRKKGQYLGG